MDNSSLPGQFDLKYSTAFLNSFEEILGMTGFSVLKTASEYQVEEGKVLDLAQAMRVMDGLRQVYGERGALALTPRIIDRFFENSLAHEDLLKAFDADDFLALSDGAKLPVAAAAFARLLEARLALPLKVERLEDGSIEIGSEAALERPELYFIEHLLHKFLGLALPDIAPEIRGGSGEQAFKITINSGASL